MELFIEAAKAFATQRLEGQTRRDGTTPFITHPIRVAQRLQDAGVTKSEILAAAILHDVLEDTPTQPSEVFARFGPRVASLVEEVSRPPGMTPSDFTERIARGSARAVLIRIADRLVNVENKEDPEGAEDALKLAATALTNPRLDRLFPAERRALDNLLAELITAGRAALRRGSAARQRDADALIATFPAHLR